MKKITSHRNINRRRRRCNAGRRLPGNGQLPEQNRSGVRADGVGQKVHNQNRATRDSLVHFAASNAKSKQAHRQADFRRLLRDVVPPCKMLEAQTYPDPKVIAESQKWVMLKIDTDQQTDLAVQYGISSLPTLAVLRADGKPVTGIGGFLDAEGFVEFLRAGEKKWQRNKICRC